MLALVPGKHLLARLIFQRIRPRTHSGMMNEQNRSLQELRRVHAAIASPDITTPPVNCADPPPTATPEIKTLFTQLARRRLPKRAVEETR